MREEIDYWLAQAKADLKSAIDLLKTDNYHASAFFSQQTTEKSLKALLTSKKKEEALEPTISHSSHVN
ncbi:MAG: HEPN domain protein [Candidatus Argoarchaeum ethanivorans]|uniref:HEPN domain protein n=1 Tax=Candidatus Argoarchaeum ethanivorans TaxID=2608793 RepID=A0A811T9J9_9EURY|nr:MAG: HEPN domain protein [Candidatus Argoarchaeum ethanivorans]